MLILASLVDLFTERNTEIRPDKDYQMRSILNIIEILRKVLARLVDLGTQTGILNPSPGRVPADILRSSFRKNLKIIIL